MSNDFRGLQSKHETQGFPRPHSQGVKSFNEVHATGKYGASSSVAVQSSVCDNPSTST